MTYSFYLFLNLRIVICPNETEYDIQYGDDKKLYMTYESSKYNDANLPEYECMVNFLNAYKEGLIAACYDVDNTPLMKYDWAVLINPEGIVHNNIIPKKGDALQFVRLSDENPSIGEFLHIPSNHGLNIFGDRTLKLNK